MNTQKPHWYIGLDTDGPVLIIFNEEIVKAQVTIDKATSAQKSKLLIQVRELPQQPQVTTWQQLAAKTNPPPINTRQTQIIPVTLHVAKWLHSFSSSESTLSQSDKSTDLDSHLEQTSLLVQVL